MIGLSLLRRLPPALTTTLFYVVTPVSLFVRFLLGTVLGAFFISLVLYWIMWTFGAPKPYTPPQLLLWIDALPNESKTAVATSILTIAGFLVAFHTARINWKAEAIAQLKADVASEIEVFFNEASRLTVDAQIYVQSLVKVMNAIQNQGTTTDTVFKVHRAIEKTPAFLSTRDRLSAMSIEVHRIEGRHYSVLSTVWGATKALADCTVAFSKITESMWIGVPYIASESNTIRDFITQVDIVECSKFVECCKQNYRIINGISGGIRGALLVPLVGFNLSALVGLFERRISLKEVLKEVHKGRRNG